MEVIQLLRKEVQYRVKVREMKIEIPTDWWDTTYSVGYVNNNNQKLINSIKQSDKKLPTTPGWNIERGDYKVKQVNSNNRDYVYYRDIKIKILKYSLYPVVFATILLISKICSILSKM